MYKGKRSDRIRGIIFEPSVEFDRKEEASSGGSHGRSTEGGSGDPQELVVIIDLDDPRFAGNKIFDVNFEDNIAAVKMVQKRKHGFVLISSAPEYPPVLSDLDWGDLCVGRAVSVWKSLDDL